MDISELMYFEKSDTSNAYCLALTKNGQVYYCVTDEDMKPRGKWKLVNIDAKVISVLH